MCTGKNAGVEDLTNIVKMVEYKSESATQKYSKCQTPPYEKNKLLLNEYLGEFMHFETIFFLAENDFFKPTHPTKVRKILHFFF